MPEAQHIYYQVRMQGSGVNHYNTLGIAWLVRRLRETE